MPSDSPDHKRQLRTADARAAAMPSTADIYGAKHGIPEDVQAALQNVGRRNRMSECGARVRQQALFVEPGG